MATLIIQFTNAKPILNQYGFKASFFITCNYVVDRQQQQQQAKRLIWNDILSLQEGGQDIQSKGMNPVDLNNVSAKDLDFETANSKQCLEDHGINSPNIFAPKYGNVWDNHNVIDAISKNYEFADNGNASLTFLHCDGYTKNQVKHIVELILTMVL